MADTRVYYCNKRSPRACKMGPVWEIEPAAAILNIHPGTRWHACQYHLAHVIEAAYRRWQHVTATVGTVSAIPEQDA